jgi:hypothetical protein
MGLAALGSFIGSVGANLATDFCKSLHAAGARALSNKVWGLDKNEHVAKAVRRAQLSATVQLLRDWRKTLPRYDATKPEKIEHEFAYALRTWLAAGNTETAIDAWVANARQEQKEEEKSPDIPSALTSAFRFAFGDEVSANERMATRADKARKVAIDSVYAELVSGASAYVRKGFGPRGCESFYHYFHEGDRRDRWFPMFMRAIGVELKGNEEFKRLWDSVQIGGIVELLSDQGVLAAERHEELQTVVKRVGDALERVGAAWDILKGDIVATRVATEQVRDALIGDTVVPLMLEAEFDTLGIRRFSPRNPRVRFLGRAAEINALMAFAGDARNFSWWLLVGSGGSGKTRLARQLCLALHKCGWRAGFLPRDWTKDGRNLDAWTPSRPTFVVVDYVNRNSEEVASLAAALARRNRSMPWPVRMLLLERVADEQIDRGFLKQDEELLLGAAYAKTHRTIAPLVLPRLTDDDVWDLVEVTTWSDRPARLEISREEFFRRLHQLDRDARPLVAMILADALVTRPETNALGSLEDVLTGLLDRDRRDFWPPQMAAAGQPLGRPEADAAIALATAIGGYRKDHEPIVMSHGGPSFSAQLIELCAAAVGRPLFVGNEPAQLAPLEPDLIGEFFTLQVLKPPRVGSFGDTPLPWFAETAWRANGRGTLDFLRRARQNFPRHPALGRLEQIVLGCVGSWIDAYERDVQIGAPPFGRFEPEIDKDPAARLAFAEVIFAWTNSDLNPHLALNPDPVLIFIHQVLALASRYPNERGLRILWARSVMRFLLHCTAYRPNECNELLHSLRRLLREYKREGALVDAWVKSIRNYVHGCAQAQLDERADQCFALLNSAKKLLDKQEGDPDLWIEWAAGITNFNFPKARPEHLTTLTSDLEAVAYIHPQSSELREKWAMTVRNFVAQFGTKSPVQSRDLLQRLAELVRKHEDERGLREHWAIASGNLVHALVETKQPEICYAELVAQRSLALKHRDETQLLLVWTIALGDFIFHCGKMLPPQSAEMLRDWAMMIKEHDEEQELGKRWAAATTWFMDEVGGGIEPGTALALLRALQEQTNVNQEDSLLSEWWAGTAVIFIFHHGAASPREARSLVDSLKDEMERRPDDPKKREAWAKSVRNYVFRCGSSHMAESRILLEELEKAIDAYRDELFLREHFAASVVNFTGFADSIPEDALALVQVLENLTMDEPSLRTPWANSVVNFVAKHSSERPVESRAVVDALHEAMERFTDLPGLRAEWASAAFNLIGGCSQSAPCVCNGLREELVAVMQRYSDDPRIREFAANLTDPNDGEMAPGE